MELLALSVKVVFVVAPHLFPVVVSTFSLWFAVFRVASECETHTTLWLKQHKLLEKLSQSGRRWVSRMGDSVGDRLHCDELICLGLEKRNEHIKQCHLGLGCHLNFNM